MTEKDAIAQSGSFDDERNWINMLSIEQSLNKKDAYTVLSDGSRLSTLYNENKRILDEDGSGSIDKLELTRALRSKACPSDAKRLANALMVGYDTLTKDPELWQLKGIAPSLGRQYPGVADTHIEYYKSALDFSLSMNQVTADGGKAGTLAGLASSLVSVLTVSRDWQLNKVSFPKMDFPGEQAVSFARIEEAQKSWLLRQGVLKPAITIGLIVGTTAMVASGKQLFDKSQQISAMLGTLPRSETVHSTSGN